MKKIALTIAAVATLGLAACNGAETTEANTAEANTVDTTTDWSLPVTLRLNCTAYTNDVEYFMQATKARD